MIDLILHLLLLGGFIFLLAELVPGIRVTSYGTALLVAIVYGIINITLGTLFDDHQLPFHDHHSRSVQGDYQHFASLDYRSDYRKF